jgi:pimeloyl-ACP methyl ester carboxylesterase
VFEAGFPLVTLWRPTSPSARTRLALITAPTLIVVGGNESSTTTADRLASSIQGARKLVIGGAGHMVNMDAPAEFTRAMVAFLDSKSVH